MKIKNSILNDIKKFLLNPKKTLNSILQSADFHLSTKTLVFIAFTQLYSLLLPSTLIFLLLLVIPFVLIIIGYVYFLSQELSILYSEANETEFKDTFLYRIAYCLSLMAVPSMLLSLVINIFFLVRADNLIVAAALSLAFNFLPLLISLAYLIFFMKVISKGEHGLLKLIELSFVSLISTLKAKFGWDAVREISVDLGTMA